ncbi:glutaredoxin family protein [Rhodococcus sp. NPDC003994]
MLSAATPEEMLVITNAGFPTGHDIRYFIDRNRDIPVSADTGYEISWLREIHETHHSYGSAPTRCSSREDQTEDGPLDELAAILAELRDNPDVAEDTTLDVTIYQAHLLRYTGQVPDKDNSMTAPLKPIHPDAPQVILYSQRGCGPCIAVQRDLQKRHIPFVKVDIREDPNGAHRISELGYNGTPVIVAGDMHWKGFRKDKMQQLDNALRAWEPSHPVAD